MPNYMAGARRLLFTDSRNCNDHAKLQNFNHFFISVSISNLYLCLFYVCGQINCFAIFKFFDALW